MPSVDSGELESTGSRFFAFVNDGIYELTSLTTAGTEWEKMAELPTNTIPKNYVFYNVSYLKLGYGI
jgi:hypothetical protein